MISKKFRFHGRGVLKKLYKNSRPVRSQSMVLRSQVLPHRSNSRFAVVVSKKIAKSAVVRNRIRRRIYEILRNCHSEIDSRDYVVIVTSPDIINISHEDLKNQLLSLINKVQSQPKN